ncbi:MAG TPA: efflux RND transporter periplasmic adaptor subunit [Haliangiales bacterium]|nr:efflux RND transporter periplasmic adaptor subunit [Haliangiales bacterium]
MRKRPGRKWIVLVAAAALAGCAHAEETRAKSPTPVRVRVVAEPTARAATRYSGTIEPDAKVDIAFKVGGYVREVAEAKGKGRKLHEGDWVTKGQILAVLDDGDYRQRASQARASLAEAIASEKQAHADFNRTKLLLESQAITQAEYDAQTARRDMAVARVGQARSQVGQAEISLGDTVLRAPFDGVVIKRGVEVGTLASPGVPAFTIADTRTAKVVFGAPDVLLGRLRIGDKLSVRVEALGKDFTAAITRISPSADAKSRTFDVEASIPNTEDGLKVGMIVSIELADLAQATSSLSLPLTAVVRAPKDPRGFAVFVVGDGDVAHAREVKLGDIVGSAVLVTAGLKPGERVIETGTTFVTDGDTVRVVR